MGYSSFIEVYPRLGYGVALLSNRAGEAQGHLKWMAERGKDRLFGKPAPLLEFEHRVQTRQFLRIAEAAAEVQRRYPAFHLAQDLLDTWAFGLIQGQRKTEGLALLAFQADRRPRSLAALLSHAEGMAATGQTDKAVRRFQEVLKLDPDNRQAIGRIQALGGQR